MRSLKIVALGTVGLCLACGGAGMASQDQAWQQAPPPAYQAPPPMQQAPAQGFGAAPMSPQPASITVNGAARPELAQQGIGPGNYWYDARSGLWGHMGGPAQGIVPAGSPAAPLPANASGGGTRVFINGREIPPSEAQVLAQLTGAPVQPGRYFLDANGNAGYEGGAPMVNLYQAAQRSSGQGTFMSSDGTVNGGVWDGGGMVSVKNPDGSFTSVGW